MKVLLVEDDEIIASGLTIALRQEGYEVIQYSLQEQVFAYLATGEYPDICILDVMLPDGNGYEICKEIRKHKMVPILFLTACDDEIHTVLALEQGADDYVTKPFRIRELIARMKAILRRTNFAEQEGDLIYIGDKVLNRKDGKLFQDGKEILLTAMEYRLLLIFINHRGQVLTRQQLLNEIWDAAGEFVNDNTLTVYVKRLREKLGENAKIQTVRGIGYCMEK